MSGENARYFDVFQDSRGAAIAKCAALAAGYGRPDLAKKMLLDGKIDASRLNEIKAKQIQGASHGGKPEP